MFGFLGLFGRSNDLRAFDQALRQVDLHPALVQDAVKLAAVRILRQETGGSEPAPSAYARAAELIAYCMIGAEGFAGANDAPLAQAVETRIEAALEAGDSSDARLVLLTLHAGVIQPSVVAHYGLEASPGP